MSQTNNISAHTPSRRTLRLTLTLFVIGVIVLTTGAVGLIGYQFAQRTLREQIEERLHIVAADRRKMLLAYVDQQHERVGLVASRTRLRQIAQQLQTPEVTDAESLRANAVRILDDAKASTDGFLDISFLDPNGKVLASTNSQPDADALAASTAFERGKSLRHLGIPQSDGEKYTAYLAAPASDAEGRLIGVIVVKLDVEPLRSLLSDPTGLGETGEVLVGFSEGETVHYLFPARDQAVLTTNRRQVPAMARAIDGRDGFMQTTDYRQGEVFAVFHPVAYQDADFRQFGMVAKFDVAEALSPIAALRNLLLVVDVISLLAGMAAAAWVARRITKPLILLTRQADVIASGDTSMPVSVQSRDEIGSLAAAFNQMTVKLRESYQTLEQRVEQRTQELAAAQEELRREAQRARAIIDTATDAFVAMNQDGAIIDWNPAAEAMFGWSSEDAMGKTVAELLVPERFRQAHLDGIRRYLETGEGPVLGNSVEIVALHVAGSEFPIELTINPLAVGDRVVFNAFIRDITRRKQAETELHDAKEAAEEASRAKSDFLANMSHEIRTPMNAIMGMTELVLDTDIDDTQRDYLQTVLDSAEHLLTIINEILDFSKIEAGRVELEFSPFSLRDSLGDTMKVLAFRAHRKGLEIAYHIAPDVPDGIVSDVARLRQIVINLVGNAIKFTETGEVLVDVSLHDSIVDDRAEFRFCVRDTGVGIPPERIETIFESFTQADSSTTRRFGGTGLGLTICKQLVELMQGRVWVESRVGQGSAFHFTLPVSIADDASIMQPVEQPDIAGMRVLVVDDNATNCKILDEMLRVWGLDPVTAEGGEEALVKLEQAHAKGQPFRLVLTDLHMPGMDGMDLIARIRQLPSLPQPTIIMLTSGERPGDPARRRDLQVSSCLMKPIKQSELLEEVLARLGAHQVMRSTDVSASEEAGPQLPPLKVLVAEDGVSNRKLIEALMQKWGHDATFAENGLMAVQHAAAETFDLILMDVEMPELDGLEATRRIRGREAEQNSPRVPIIALTAHALQGDRERCLAAGMDSYVSKPIRARALLDAIGQLIHADAPAPSPNTHRESSGPVQPAKLGGFDVQAARDALGGDDELLAIVVNAFLEEAPKLLGNIREAVEAKDCERLRVAAHALKGSVRYYGETAAYELAYRLEVAAAAGSCNGAHDCLSRLEAEIAALREALTPLV